MSTNALKIILQILNVIGLIVAILAIAVGISILDSSDSMNEIMHVVAWICIFSGLLSLFFQVFGIYAVSKEHAGKVKTYGTIHLVLLILNVINSILALDFVYLASNLIFSGAIIYLSYELAERFRKKTTIEVTPPPYDFTSISNI